MSFAALRGPDRAADTAVTAGCNMAFFVRDDAARPSRRRGAAADALVFQSPDEPRHARHRAAPAALPADAGFVPRVEDAEALIDGQVRAIVLVTPNNPTGAVYPAHVIESFAQLCRKHGIYLVIDETYRDFLPQGMNHPHGLSLARNGAIR